MTYRHQMLSAASLVSELRTDTGNVSETADRGLFASELRKDADKFSKEMETVIFCSEAAQERLVTARVDYLKAAETDGANHQRLADLHEEVNALAQESVGRFQHMLCMIRRHREFLLGMASALEGK
jgi:hypothetical protein